MGCAVAVRQQLHYICYLQPGIRINLLKTKSIEFSSRFDNTGQANATVQFHEIEVVAPDLGALRAQNPYH
eukprot:IDg2621t1